MRTGSRAMKKLIFLGLGSALIFTMGGVGPAQADNGPHRSTAKLAGSGAAPIAGATRCASCHRAHTAKAEYLLKDAQPGLCYTCHGSTAPGSTTDVVNGNDGGTAALRGGGFKNAQIDSGSASKTMGALDPLTGRIATTNQTIPALIPPVGGFPGLGNVTSKHQIDGVTGGTAWGNGAISATQNLGKSITLECGSCHDPHGNGNYRILRPIPVDSGVTAPAVGVKIPDALGKVYTTANYWLAGDTNVAPDPTAVLTGTPGPVAADGYINNIASWCTTCHTRYLAPTGSYKTASGDATFMYRHRSDANYKAGAANCITCHVSHGSNAVMTGTAIGLNPGDTPVVGADSRLLRVDNRGTCVMCHNV